MFGAGLVVDTIGAPFSTGVIELGWLGIPFATLALLGGSIGLSSHFAGVSDGLMFALLGAAYFLGVRRLVKAMPSANTA